MFGHFVFNISNNNDSNNRIQRHLFNAPRTVSNMFAQVARAQSFANHVHTSSANHVHHVVLHATWYEGTAQLLRQSLNCIYFSFIQLAEPLN